MLDRNNSSNNSEDIIEKENEDVGFVSGVIRGILRSIGYVTRIESIGRLPVRIPHKIVAKSADRLGQLHEFQDMVRDTYQESRQRNPGSHATALFQTGILTSHGLVKSAVLGGILFSIYETTVAAVAKTHYLSHMDDSSHFFEFVVLPTAAFGTAGACAGSTHGIMYSIWDRGLSVLPSKWWPASVPKSSPIGTAISHACVHGTLFGSYEVCKRGSLFALGYAHREEHLSKVEGGLCVVFGGCVAGVLSDGVGRVTVGLEQSGVSSGVAMIRSNFQNFLNSPELTKQPVKTFVRSALPTTLGFLAFEYAKELAASSSSD
jgi:hypothetical protein